MKVALALAGTHLAGGGSTQQMFLISAVLIVFLVFCAAAIYNALQRRKRSRDR